MDPRIIDLESGRLRPFRAEDAGPLARLADDREIWINLRDRFPHPYTLKDAEDWIGHLAAISSTTDLAIEVDGQVAGAIGHVPGEDVSRRSAEVDYWIGRPYWGRGIATAAVRALTARLLGRTGFDRLHATVFAWNLASARVLEKAGYALEGRLKSAIYKDGRTTDGLVYGIVRQADARAALEAHRARRNAPGVREAEIRDREAILAEYRRTGTVAIREDEVRTGRQSEGTGR